MIPLPPFFKVAAAPRLLACFALASLVFGVIAFPLEESSSLVRFIYALIVAVLNAAVAAHFLHLARRVDAPGTPLRSVATRVTIVYVLNYVALAIFITTFDNEWLADLSGRRGLEQQLCVMCDAFREVYLGSPCIYPRCYMTSCFHAAIQTLGCCVAIVL